jgi:hypothetical protein
MPMFKYVAKAFVFHWNLLMVFAAIALAVISGKTGVILPLAAAVEIIYLAALSTNPRFRKLTDATEQYDDTPRISSPKTERILSALSDQDRRQFGGLKDLCLELRRITLRVKEGESKNITEIKDDGINRLLWIYLKLLHSKGVLESFFKTIDRKEIESSIWRTMQRISEMGEEQDDTPDASKRRKSLKDMLETSELRLKNYENAMKNHEFIGIELERLSSKIASIAEMGIGRQDADFISTEIDLISDSVRQTEQTVNDIEFLTGLSFDDKDIPALLE